jgi:hypothetical protein
MNKTYGILAVLLVASASSLLGLPAAEVSDTAYRDCKERVREEMERTQAKALDGKVAEAVDSLCRLGKTEEALRFALPAQTERDCVNRVRREAAAPVPTLGKEELSRAHDLCRRGDIEAAFAILDGSSGAGPAIEVPSFPKILALSFSPQSIQAGQATTLQWRTADASHVEVGQSNPQWPQASPEPILEPLRLDPSGSVQIHPSATTTYRLRAIGGAGKTALKDATVVVTSAPPPAATCSITGRLTGKLDWDTRDDRGQPVSFHLTHMVGRVPGADRPLTARVRGGTFTFEDVPAGTTLTIGPGGYRSNPGERKLSCVAGTARPGADFEITGPPPSG